MSERTAVARIAFASAVGRASSALSLSPVLRWRHGSADVDGLLILPRDLRSADATFATELVRGEMGLAGHAALFGPEGPFDIAPPSTAWRDELHGFGWLRHVVEARSDEALELALDIVEIWIARFSRQPSHPAWQPGIAGRRTLSWLAHVAVLLEDAEPERYDRTMRCLGAHLVHLSATWSLQCDGYDRLLAAIARVAGDVCVAGREGHLTRSGHDLASELSRQIDQDGANVSRNPDTLVEILLDLLPVHHCVRSRDLSLPGEVQDAMERMMPMVRHVRIGRAGLARFNGGGRSGIEAVAAVLGHDPRPEEKIAHAPHAGYARLEAGPVTALVDVGKPPPVGFSGRAHAGCLSFELAIDGELVFMNCGGAGAGPDAGRAGVRATARHSTLTLADRSSAALLKAARLESMAGGPPLTMTGRVEWSQADTENLHVVEASHEGYLEMFGLVHRRRLELTGDGLEFSGIDRIGGVRSQTVRLKQDLPLAIRFHLAETIEISAGPWPDGLELQLPNGEVWRFLVTGALLSLEESPRYDSSGSACTGTQIVLRATTFGESEIRWHLTRREPHGPVSPHRPLMNSGIRPL